jgi:hypothetical protein
MLLFYAMAMLKPPQFKKLTIIEYWASTISYDFIWWLTAIMLNGGSVFKLIQSKLWSKCGWQHLQDESFREHRPNKKANDEGGAAPPTRC